VYDKYRDELSNTICFGTLYDKRSPLIQKSVTDKVCHLLKKIDRLKLNNMIINIGQILPSEVPDYISNVNVMFLPTLLETFCNLYIESMKYQCPIITSDLDFSHPVCGDAALDGSRTAKIMCNINSILRTIRKNIFLYKALIQTALSKNNNTENM
jgi:hypothetical protein